METVQILEKANTAEGLPQNWLVFPLLRNKVILGLFGWAFGIIAGGLIFAFMASVMIPHNYQNGVASAIVTTLILAMVLYICLGSLWALVVDIIRLLHASQHVIVITPDDFVKQEGKKIIHVPLEYVKYVTARGKAPVDRSLESARKDTSTMPSLGENVASLVVGRHIAESGKRGIKRKNMRTPQSLAFIDSRTDKEVTVVNDGAYGDPHYIGAHLKEYANSAQKNK